MGTGTPAGGPLMGRLVALASLAALAGAIALPWALQALDAEFYLSFASRIVIFAIAATSLNLLLGYGGMVSLGLPTFKVKLVIFVVAGVLAGVAGALNVNLQGYVSPNQLHWTQSGTLLVMVILGGVGTVWGGVLGAAALLLLQEVLSAYTRHWGFWTGWVLLAVVLFARQGLSGLATSALARLRRSP